MAIVAGVDFGTLNVRVSLVDSQKGRLGSGIAEYPLLRKPEDPDHATQPHSEHLRALVEATEKALAASGVSGADVEALAIDTTGSSVIPLDENLQPLNDYYLWCDHRAWREALEISAKAHEYGLEAIEWSGGTYSSEWGFSKILHFLRHNPDKRDKVATFAEHCDYIAAVLSGITRVEDMPRSVCAMGHKWMWNEALGGLPPEEFLVQVDPLFKGVREKIGGTFKTSDQLAGRLSEEWAAKLGLRAGIPIPTGALDAHWDAIAAGCRVGDVVNVIGTSTCIIAMSDSPNLVPGVCGVVPGSVHPKKTGIEAGLSAVGEMFDAIAKRANSSVAELAKNLDSYAPGQTGLLRMTWDNGDRTVLVNPELGGVTLGWKLTHTAADELFAAIEGTAFHTRIILERMQEHGTAINSIINGGGIPQRSPVLNQIYANVLNKPVLVPASEVTSLGSAIFGFLAAGAFASIEEAQDALCPEYRVVEPQPEAVVVYEQLFALYRKVYFALGTRDAQPAPLGDVLPELRLIAEKARKSA